jgi:hypothetical protein
MLISPRDRYHLMAWLVAPLGAVACGLLMLYVRPWLGVLLVVWAIAIEVALRRVLCPRCGKPVDVVAGNVRSFFRRRQLIPRECDQCGERLDQP